VPIYSQGHFGLRSNRGEMTPEEQHAINRTILIEHLVEVATLAAYEGHLAVEDQLTTRLRVMVRACNATSLPMYAIFCAQVFIDIHHELRELVQHPFKEWQLIAKRVMDNIDKYAQFSGHARVREKLADHDAIIMRVREFAQNWAFTDHVHRF
jgi:hypothetical protein